MPVLIDLPSADEPGATIRVDAASIRRVQVLAEAATPIAPACLVCSEEGSGNVGLEPEAIWSAIYEALDEADLENPMIEALRSEVPGVTINRARAGYVVAILGSRGAPLIWPGGTNQPGLVAAFLRDGAPRPQGNCWGA